jgi:hypothetical protein
MAGCADDVMGLIERTVLGRVTVVGKRIGEMNALLYVRFVSVRFQRTAKLTAT